MDSSEMTDWQAYDRLHPIGVGADRYLLATLVAVSVNANLDRKKRRPVSPDDFMPGIEPGPDTSQEDVILEQQAMLQAMGAAWEARQRQKQKADA